MITKALKDMRQILEIFGWRNTAPSELPLPKGSAWLEHLGLLGKKSSKHSYEKKTAQKLYIVGENS